jgi:1,2-dihydroxy-3-keto-5-methylthiopentene dioxygenase
MSNLRIYRDTAPQKPLLDTDDAVVIARELGTIGVRFERWRAAKPIGSGAAQNDVLAAYRGDIDRLMREGGYRTADVISLTPTHPDKAALRRKFLDEHTHAEDEIRFFVDGAGLFYLHAGERVYGAHCAKGDLIGVPAGTTHWFDMGPNPHLACIRIFTNPEGWIAEVTGSDIGSRFPKLEN